MTIDDNFLSEVTHTDTFDLLDNMGAEQNTNHPSPDEEDPDENQEEEVIEDDVEDSDSKNDSGDISKLEIFAKQWKTDGRLPKDFVIDDKLTEEKIDTALYDHKVKSIADQKFEDYIKEKGVTEDEIAKLRGQKLGVDLGQYDMLKAYTELSKMDLDEDEESYQEDLKQFLTVYYKDLQVPAKKIDRTVQDDLDGDDLEDTLKEAKKHFASKSKILSKNIEDSENAKIKEKDDKIAYYIEKEKAYLKAEKIGDVTFTAAEKAFLEKALYEKTEMLNLPGGKNVKVTLYQKKVYEASNNPEKAFLSKAKFILEDLASDTATEKAAKGILKELGAAIDQTKYKSSNNKRGLAMKEL